MFWCWEKAEESHCWGNLFRKNRAVGGSFSGGHRRSQMSLIGLWLLQACSAMETLTWAVLEWLIISNWSSAERKVSPSLFPPFAVQNLFSHGFVAFKDSHRIVFICVTQRWELVGGQLLAAACVNTRLLPCCIRIKAQTVTEVLLMRVKNLDSL